MNLMIFLWAWLKLYKKQYEEMLVGIVGYGNLKLTEWNALGIVCYYVIVSFKYGFL